MLTKNHKPITINHKPTNNITAAPEGVSVDVWYSFVEQRKKSRAVITETVINSIQKEANKAGWTLEMALAECAARGWRGFKADWVKSDQEKEINKPSKTMKGIMLLQDEIDRLKNEGKRNEFLKN
jgi:predicted Zn-ribbon and HTH transcriptional regulator